MFRNVDILFGRIRQMVETHTLPGDSLRDSWKEQFVVYEEFQRNLSQGMYALYAPELIDSMKWELLSDAVNLCISGSPPCYVWERNLVDLFLGKIQWNPEGEEGEDGEDGEDGEEWGAEGAESLQTGR